MLIRIYIERVLKPKEQFLELGIPIPRNIMPTNYPPINAKPVYYHKAGAMAVRFELRGRKALEKRI